MTSFNRSSRRIRAIWTDLGHYLVWLWGGDYLMTPKEQSLTGWWNNEANGPCDVG